MNSITLPPQQTSLCTQRLLLRPFHLSDAPHVQRLAGDRAVAATTLTIPHPYEEGCAEEWIASHPARFREGKGIHYAITFRMDGTLCGAIGLTLDAAHLNAELGYWIGRPYWGHGYGTEAARAVVQYGFETLHLNRIHAAHFSGNGASGRIMQKLGMVCEGCLRQHTLKWGRFEDVCLYGILQQDWQQDRLGQQAG